MSEPFLIGDAMTGGYGKGPDILHDCTISVDPGEIAVIVGPNGAGKSTAMKALFGMLNVNKGAVRLDGEDITSLTPQQRVVKGMGFVPQTHNMYAALDNDDDATTATGGTTTTLNAAAMTTGSTLTGAHTTAVPESIANAINSYTPTGADMRPVFFRAPLEISNFSNTHPLT